MPITDAPSVPATPAVRNRGRTLACLGLATFALLALLTCATGITYVAYQASRVAQHPSVAVAEVSDSRPEREALDTQPAKPPNAGQTAPKETSPAPKPPPPPTESVLAPERQKKVNEAIDKGVAYLKQCVKAGGVAAQDSWTEPTLHLSVAQPGVMALTGLCLLSCGVPADYPEVKTAAVTVRLALPQLADTNATYALAVAILFLDKLGDKRDEKLIQDMALRLIAAQNTAGGWPYSSPVIDATTSEALLDALKKPNPLGPDAPASLKKYPALTLEPGKIALDQTTVTDLSQPTYSDNSLVQFVVLGLWAARKHGVPVRRSLLIAAERFRTTQNDDGGWGYRFKGTAAWAFFDSMTCAGLLTLAAARGTEEKNESGKGLLADPSIEKALKYASKTIGKDRLPPNAPKPDDLFGPHRGDIIGAYAWGDLYYLWTLQRTASVYGLKEVGGKEWYPWAAELIVETQQADGSWRDRFPGPIDTCFALLVLKRANVVPDLTATLRENRELGIVATPPKEPPERKDSRR
jgi:hypothetical protein